jgi:hypothetical protein
MSSPLRAVRVRGALTEVELALENRKEAVRRRWIVYAIT